ncbi:ABC transporter releated protein [Methanocaldococcus vulcanius M7]|uniref:Molybdate/tungstate import ATP-binding protein WtpC n=1 Tax=Methanocaldococcus vulcanius (strain ATCC 700851 / DSM 12094 / M7) TaxID=579137 RepID=C9RGL9_METVM|nr:ATP-binding cassette domain-containing protein [Methanocaldococcus vulcanius]ACX72721.1 ABC transporter releated protein [Methanocaldococcus vulcanius M7]
MLKIVNLEKKLAYFTLKIDDLEVYENDYFVVLGSSGSGKTTLLEILAGFRKADMGSIYLDGEDITNKPISDRKIVMCHGKYLFPHLSVKDNIGIGIRNKKIREEKVKEISKMLGISHLLNRNPKTLSRGEQQRVALARALVVNPKIILLDEPLSALDKLTHENLIIELKKIHESSDLTFIHVTHDFIEAIALAKHMAIIKDGNIEQFGDVNEIINTPKNEFVARFVGYKNFLKGKIKKDGKKYIFKGDLDIIIDKPQKEGNAILAIRPEDIMLVGDGGCRYHYNKENIFDAEIIDVYPLSLSTVRAILDVNGITLICEVIRSKANRMGLKKDMNVKISISSSVIIRK